MDVQNNPKDSQALRTILLVDDSAYVRRMIRFALAQQPYRLLEANDGIDALKCMQGNQVDLVVTDLKMPNMDGFDLIRHIRSDAKNELLPIIMLTGESDEKSREVARKVGVSAFIIKPFVPEQISGLIKSIFA